MRFMILVPASKESEAGALPDAEGFGAMGKFNEEMVKAGVMLAGEGLAPSSQGARLTFAGGGKTTVVDGPFTESKDLIAGFWLIQVRSKEEAVAWMKRAPFGEGVKLEIRRVHEPADFAAINPTGELRAKEQKLREMAASQKG